MSTAVNKAFRDIESIVAFAASTNESDEYSCDDITIEEDGEEFCAYAVHVSNREMSFYTDKGCLHYFVDTYGGRHTWELQSIERGE